MRIAIPHGAASRLARTTTVPRASRLAGPTATVSAACVALAGVFLLAFGAPLPANQDVPAWLAWDESLSELPSADAPAADLLCNISSPMTFARFLTMHSHRYRHANPLAYTKCFRMDLEEFQQAGWEGDCNDFANAICELGHHHGYPMGIVSMWPIRLSERLERDWHQIAVLCLRQDRAYLIFEFERPIWWKGSLEDYARSHDRMIMPIGGVLEWRPTKRNPLARFMDHLRLNTPLPENQRPLPAPPRHPVT